MSQHDIQVKNINFSYPDGQQAVKNLSFEIGEGESVGIIGANGAGKSTLLMLLMGVLFSDSGEISVGASPINKKNLTAIRKQLGMVFQDPDDQLFMTTVYEDVAFGPRNYGMTETEVEKCVTEALESLGITHLKERAPYKLSGGEKRAAAIATVLSMNPDVLIMDEPTAALDPKSRRRIMNLLNLFNHTKIITSHDLDMVFETCSRIIVIKDGQVAADGAAKEILSDEALLERCGLEMPLSLQNCLLCNGKKGL